MGGAARGRFVDEGVDIPGERSDDFPTDPLHISLICHPVLIEGLGEADPAGPRDGQRSVETVDSGPSIPLKL